MKRHRGSTLTLVIAGVVILFLVGSFFFLVTKVFTGSKETINATDAGAINLAKQALTEPGVSLKEGEEKETFGRLLDKNAKVTLRTYNRIVGSAMLIALNAQKLGTSQALDNAQKALALAQTGEDSIGKRLAAELQKGSSHKEAFEKIAQMNSTRMVGADSKAAFQEDQFAVSFMERGAGANIYLPKGAPYKIAGSALSKDKDGAGNTFFKGYESISLGQNLNYMFVPVNPEKSPHLVSSKDFEKDKQSPLQNKIPCNSFKSVAIAEDNKTKIGSAGFSIVGATDSKYPLSTSGYIKIVNPKGYPGQNYHAVRSIYTDELMTGIFLIGDKSGKAIAFSTDPTAAAQWKAYNQNPGSTKPELIDKFGNPVVFDIKGNVASDTVLNQITGSYGPAAGCNVTNVGLHGNKECMNLIPNFYNAYPAHDDPDDALEDKKQYTAIQQASWDLARTLHLISGPNGHNAAGKKEVGAFLRAPREYTGQIKFDNKAQYYYANLFKQPDATISQLVKQVSGAESVLVDLKERIREIKPEVSDAGLDKIINRTTLPLGTTLYIYKDKDENLVMSKLPPEGVNSNQAADGPNKIFKVTYQTIFKSVDQPFNPGDWRKPWLWPPPADKVALGTDEVRWTPGSGYRGVLGVLEFRNYCQGDGWFYWAN